MSLSLRHLELAVEHDVERGLLVFGAVVHDKLVPLAVHKLGHFEQAFVNAVTAQATPTPAPPAPAPAPPTPTA